MINDLESKYQLKSYAATIANINYFNDNHKIIRVEFNKRFYDFKLLSSGEIPNPLNHIVLLLTTEEALSEIKALSQDRLNLLPGYIDNNGNLDDLPVGFGYLISKKQSISVTNPNSGGAGFSISKNSMSQLDNVSVAITPPLDRDYTNTEKDSYSEDQNVGLFINKNGSILIKSTGSSITMGEEGIYIGGNVSWESSEHNREILVDNPLQRFIPSTIVSAIPSIPELPNISKFANIANAAKKIRNVVSSLNSVNKIIKG